MAQDNKKISTLVEYIAESSTACLVTMVQGNVLALTVSHLLIASQTGIIAGALATTSLIIAKTDKRWVVSVVLGIATAIVDYFVHPGMFGPIALEAIVTGIGAAVLSYFVGMAIRGYRKKAA